jgi:flagellar protein FlbD
MIRVTKLNNEEIVINNDLIEFVESIPETIISLTDGKKIMVKESPDEIIKRVAAFHRMAYRMDYSEQAALKERKE